MEKFFKIKKDSELWKKYFDWEKNFKENNEFVKRRISKISLRRKNLTTACVNLGEIL